MEKWFEDAFWKWERYNLLSGLLGVGLGLLILIWPQALSVIAAFFMMISGFIPLSFYRKSRDFFGAVREMDRFGRD